MCALSVAALQGSWSRPNSSKQVMKLSSSRRVPRVTMYIRFGIFLGLPRTMLADHKQMHAAATRVFPITPFGCLDYGE
jgi:hypothetical protein